MPLGSDRDALGSALPELHAGTISLAGIVLLSALDPGLTAEPDAAGAGLFLRARAERTNSRLVFRGGQIPLLRRYSVCHRYEPYWMKPKAGTRLSDVPPETQFLLGELEGGQWLLIVPLIDEPFRFSLRGHAEDRLELLAETGDPHLPGAGGRALFVAAGPEPFGLLERAARSVAAQLGSLLRTQKPVPDFVDSFGWCTWDAFYQEVSAEALRSGLVQFRAGGVAPRFVILDDGWQSVRYMPTGERRLTAFAANEKFGGDVGPSVHMAKTEFGVTTFLVWHAIAGYWGGVDGAALPGYRVVEQARRFGEGILAHQPRFNEDWWGAVVGLVPESDIGRFFDDYHRHLAERGVDGVKVDSQAVLEGIAAHQGGRVRLTRAYRQALEASVQRHFAGRLINCMANAQETFYGSPASTLTRTSIDFFPERPETHAEHLYANSQVGLWFGHFMLPDWDMFQSAHAFGAFHAAGRALSGGPVYVSDAPGKHDFGLLRKLVCSDGTVLRADQPGLPTLRCLCVDPTRERVPLEIWNRVGAAGLLGVFHACGSSGTDPVRGCTRPSDVPGLVGQSFACYAHVAGRLELLEAHAERAFTLGDREFEIFSYVPADTGFAALGLTGKFNGLAAISASRFETADHYRVELRDVGEFLAYAARAPHHVRADVGEPRDLAFSHDRRSGELRVSVPSEADRRFSIFW